MNYIIYDLEATCWDTPQVEYDQEIIEIGAFRVNEFGEVRGKFNRFVRPVVNPTLSTFCLRLTGIDQVDVNRADTFPYVIDEFIEWAKIDYEDYLLCSWGSFDRKMLAIDCKRHDIDHEWVESHANLKEAYRILKGHKNGQGLRRAVEGEGMEFSGVQHRGISDAENLTKLFLKHLGEWKV